jgi:AcrR family transcriptional regulator
MPTSSTRAIGRAAVRDELARIALTRFIESGFDDVTFEDLAGAAGVSRSTFLRYFGNKEDVALHAFGRLDDAMPAALEEHRDVEDVWASLRRAVEPAIRMIVDEPTAGLALLRLVWRTPALWSRLHEKQGMWRPSLVEGLRHRGAGREAPVLALQTQAMAALGCVMIAYDAWIAGDGLEDLEALTDAAFAALTHLGGGTAPSDPTTVRQAAPVGPA